MTGSLHQRVLEKFSDAVMMEAPINQPEVMSDFKRKNIVIVGEKSQKSNASELVSFFKKCGVNELRVVSLKDKDDDYILSDEDDVQFSEMLSSTIADKPIYIGRKSLMHYGIGRFEGEAKAQEFLVHSPRDGAGIVPADKPWLIGGRGSIGKTTALFELAIKSACQGSIELHKRRWMGQKLTEKVGVSVILTWEEDHDSIHRKVRAIADANGIDPSEYSRNVIIKSYQDVDVNPEPLIVYDSKTKTPKPTEEYFALTEELREIESQVGRIGLIVIDNVGTAFGIEGNSYQEANGAMKWIQRWSSEFSCSVGVVAHTNKSALNKDPKHVPGDDEVLSTVMGSTGWTSAVRAALVMWQMHEEQEEKLAETMDDKEFIKGETRRKYIHAQVLKENCDAYTGRLTLRRDAGLTLSDVSKDQKRATAQKIEELHKSFVRAIKDAKETGGFCFQKSGKHGVFENRDKLRGFEKYSKAQLHGICDHCIANDMLKTTTEHPMGEVVSKNAAWLVAK